MNLNDRLEVLKKETENLKISGYDARRSIDILNAKIQGLNRKYNNIVAQIYEKGKEVEIIIREGGANKDDNDNNRAK